MTPPIAPPMAPPPAPRRIIPTPLFFPEEPPVIPGMRRFDPSIERVAWLFAQALYRAEVERQEQVAANGRKSRRRVND